MDDYIYRFRAVAFLDVLGFRNKLHEFEEEARENRIAEIEEGDESNINGKYISGKANEYINTFLSAIEKLDKQKFSCYLFSDNICITSISHTTPSDLEDLLLIIAELYFDLAKKGYFLRGGIDYGLFIDENMIAVGVPLANAYELEKEVAIYPRIILSETLVNQFQKFNDLGETVFNHPFAEQLISSSCERKYLNIFLHVMKSGYREEKEDFFTQFRTSIVNNLENNKAAEKVFIKYHWLADEFNSFIDNFISNIAFLDENINPDDEPGFLEFVNQQKIGYVR